MPRYRSWDACLCTTCRLVRPRLHTGSMPFHCTLPHDVPTHYVAFASPPPPDCAGLGTLPTFCRYLRCRYTCYRTPARSSLFPVFTCIGYAAIHITRYRFYLPPHHRAPISFWKGTVTFDCGDYADSPARLTFLPPYRVVQFGPRAYCLPVPATPGPHATWIRYRLPQAGADYHHCPTIHSGFACRGFCGCHAAFLATCQPTLFLPRAARLRASYRMPLPTVATAFWMPLDCSTPVRAPLRTLRCRWVRYAISRIHCWLCIRSAAPGFLRHIPHRFTAFFDCLPFTFRMPGSAPPLLDCYHAPPTTAISTVALPHRPVTYHSAMPPLPAGLPRAFTATLPSRYIYIPDGTTEPILPGYISAAMPTRLPSATADFTAPPLPHHAAIYLPACVTLHYLPPLPPCDSTEVPPLRTRRTPATPANTFDLYTTPLLIYLHTWRTHTILCGCLFTATMELDTVPTILPHHLPCDSDSA